MLRFLGRRLLAIIPVVLVVTFLVFVLIELSPGDAATQLAGDTATTEQVQAIRSELHLNEPFLERYGDWLSGAVHGDFGTSYVTKKPVIDSILDAAPITLSLGLVSLVMALGIGMFLGVIGALKPRGLVDRGVTALSSVMLAIPSFWLALVLILIFAVNNPIFPTIGYAPLLQDGPYEWLRHLILPSFALAVSGAATIALQLKAALIAEDGSDYLLAARAKGLTRNTLLFKHSFKNAAVPVVTILGFRVATLLGGTIIVESIFVLPGLGLLAAQAAIQQDVPMLLGVVTFTATFILVINMLVDASYGYLNPKLRV
ncbi:MAG: ABC transporter permease [Acidimicrobiia bacterium]